MIKSMTAYAIAEKTGNEFEVTVEIRSYNSRFLDIKARIPKEFSLLEEKVKSLISGRLERGRVEITLRMTDTSENAYDFEINEPKAAALHKVLSGLKKRFDIDAEISLDLLTRIEGIFKPVETEKNMDQDWPVIEGCIHEAIDSLNVMRKKEGEFLAEDISSRLDYIGKCIDIIEKESQGLVALYQKRLKDRIAALTKDIVEIDPGRIAQEAAFLSDKSDISEEIVRVRSHIKQFGEIMNSDESAGRKLNFLIQEFVREFNTIGSKTGNAGISHTVVDAKSELEKIREQVQNIE